MAGVAVRNVLLVAAAAVASSTGVLVVSGIVALMGVILERAVRPAGAAKETFGNGDANGGSA